MFAKAELEAVQDNLEKVDSRATGFGKQVSSLETQLAESQERVQEETKQRQAVQTKLRQAEDKAASLQEQLEEEEETRKNLETKMANLTVQVSVELLISVLHVVRFVFELGVGCVFCTAA